MRTVWCFGEGARGYDLDLRIQHPVHIYVDTYVVGVKIQTAHAAPELGLRTGPCSAKILRVYAVPTQHITHTPCIKPLVIFFSHEAVPIRFEQVILRNRFLLLGGQ